MHKKQISLLGHGQVQSRILIIVVLLILFSTSLLGCTGESSQQSMSKGEATSTMPADNTAEPSNTPPKPTQTKTLSPTPTPTATPTKVVTPQPITEENIGKLELTGMLGKGSLGTVAWSPDGATLAVPTSTGLYCYSFDGKKFSEERLLAKGKFLINALFSPDGKLIYSGSRDGKIFIVNSFSGRVEALLEGHEDEVSTISITNDGSKLASGSRDHTIRIWDLSTREQLQVITPGRGFVLSVSFSPDGSKLASSTAYPELTVHLWDVETGLEIQKIQGCEDYDREVQFNPDGKTIVVNCGIPLFWEFGSGNVWSPIKSWAGTYVFTPDGKELISTREDQAIVVRNTSNWEEKKVISGLPNAVKQLSITQDGVYLAAVLIDNSINVWNLNKGLVLDSISGSCFGDWINFIEFKPDYNLLYTADYSGEIKFWSVHQQNITKQFSAYVYMNNKLAVSSSSNEIATAYNDRIAIWSATSAKLIRLMNGAIDEYTSEIDFSPDGKLVAAGDKNKIHLWDTKTGAESLTIRGNLGMVWSVDFSPDNLTLASGSLDGSVKLWDANTGYLIRTVGSKLSDVRDVSFSPGGELLAAATADGRNVIVWDTLGFQEVFKLGGFYDWVNCLSFSPDGMLLAAGSSDGTVRIWSLDDGEELAFLRGQESKVIDINFSPDGTILATAGGDSAVRLWKISNTP